MDKTNISLNYKAAREKLRTGDLIVFSNKKFSGISGLITFIVRFFTISEYNHVGILWKVGVRYFVVEAQIPQVKITPLSKMGSFFYMPMVLDVQEPHMDKLLEKVGEDYGKLEAIKAYFKKSSMSNNQWICVELVRFFYEQFGIEMSDCFTPSDIVNQLMRKYGKQLIYVENKPAD